MDPLLVAAYSSTAPGGVGKNREAEEAFYARHGGRMFERAFPAASAVAVMVALVVMVGLVGR